MATILERKYPSGRVVYRMIFNRRGLPIFRLTFEEREAAADFAAKHEKQFIANPQFYFDWRERIYYRMKREGVSSKDGLSMPRGIYMKVKNDYIG